MEKIYNTLKSTVQIICTIATIGLVVWCVYNHYLDEDLSLIETKSFGEKENYILPSTSICFSDPFLPGRNIKNNHSSNQYKKFLLGTYWNETLLELDFESITTKLENHFLGYIVFWKNLTYQRFEPNNTFVKNPQISYIGPYLLWIIKCYSFEIPNDALWFGIRLKRNIFPNSIRQSFYKFGVNFHYPGQFVKSVGSMRSHWPSQGGEKTSFDMMLMKITTFDITLRRNTRQRPCNKEWKNDDQHVFKKFLGPLGCRAPYQNWISDLPICNSKKKMAESNFPLMEKRDKKINEPCQSAERIEFEYQEIAPESERNIFTTVFPRRENSFFLMTTTKSPRFNVLISKQAYDFQSLIGNSGGYIGLFLGNYMFF